ncbi:glutamate-gated chloride channel-like [Oppia nitens]|uniref:glutamate-gated chloride channel-like n=1 Tax=Oppia nitens TaxID=1686743 RepID=UPI0023DCAFDB|nr:glutamate-gated chloride channel-like [Oppia nitens]
MFKYFILILLLSATVFGQNLLQLRDQEKQLLDQLLDKSKYDQRIAPVGISENGTQGAVTVTINIYTRLVEHICTENQEWKVQLTFRQQWADQRLKYDDRTNGKLPFLTLEDSDRLWTPDTFISNARSTEINTDLKPNRLIRIYPSGEVLFSTRITSVLTCPMDLRHYPFDQQKCPIQLASYGYTTNDIVYVWKSEQPIQVSKSLHKIAPDWSYLDNYETTNCTSSTLTGNYSCIKTDLLFGRNAGKYGCQWFLPTAVLTFVSFVSFLFKPEKSTRVKFLLVTLLLLYVHIVYINSRSLANDINYNTAKDCWTSTCLVFVLATFVEYAVVLAIGKLNKHCPKHGGGGCGGTNTDANGAGGRNGKSVNNCEEGDAVALKPLVTDNDDLKTKTVDGADDEDTKELTTGGGGSLPAVNPSCNRRLYAQKWRDLSLGRRIDLLSAIIFPKLFIAYIIIFFVFETMA